MRELIGKSLNNVRFSELDGDLCASISGSGVEAYYKIRDIGFRPRAEAVMMDLDGTTLDSEPFWVYMIQLTVARLLGNPRFELEDADIPFVSGYTTIEHLKYCIEKYCPGADVNKALLIYHEIAGEELEKIMRGEGNVNEFKPREGLSELLRFFKSEGIRIGLATSGLDYKSIPEIVSVFRQIGLGDPLDYYDAIITGGKRKGCGDYGSVGEIAAKPHPWLYTELAYAGLHVESAERTVIIEDSAAGVISGRCAGFPVIGMSDGNISRSGLDSLCLCKADDLISIKKIII